MKCGRLALFSVGEFTSLEFSRLIENVLYERFKEDNLSDLMVEN
ncbi:hypothetical protein [Archaeoglobus sp.]